MSWKLNPAEASWRNNRQKTVKYIGVEIDNDLSRMTHVDKVHKHWKLAVTQKAAVSYHTTHYENAIPGFVLHHLDYCSCSDLESQWNNTEKKLERVQNYAIIMLNPH